MGNPSVHGVGLTHIGKVRLVNEDSFCIDNQLGLFVVADGMGGHAAGEIASSEACDTVLGMVRREQAKITAFQDRPDDPKALSDAKRLLESAVQAATYMIYGLAQHSPEQHGMGTTVSAVILSDHAGVLAQVGDSRVYRAREQDIEALTEDHTLVAWQVKQGIISEEEAELSPHRNVITRAVGSREYVQVDTFTFPTRPGDTYLLCSDGLYSLVSEKELYLLLQRDPPNAVQDLIDLANERGGTDNITAIIASIN